MLSFGDPYLFQHFFCLLSFPFSGSPVHSDPFGDLKFKTTEHFKHRTTGPEGRPSAWETNDRQPRDIAFLGFTWGSHRHPSGSRGRLSAGGPRVCGEPRPRPSPRPLPPLSARFAAPAPVGARAPKRGPSYPPLPRDAADRGLRARDATRDPPPGEGGSPRTAPPALTSALTCRTSPHSAPARRSLCSGCGGRGQSQVFPESRPSLPPPRPTNSARQPRTSPAVGEGGSLAPEPAPRAVRPAGPPESGERSRPATPKAQRGRRASAGPGRRRGRRAGAGRGRGLP